MHPPYTMYPFEFITKKKKKEINIVHTFSNIVRTYTKVLFNGCMLIVYIIILYILLYRHVLAATQLTHQPDMVRFYGIAACRKLHIYNIHIIHIYTTFYYLWHTKMLS